MNTSPFSSALSELDEKYIEEALCYRPDASRRSWIKWGAAACLALIFASVWLLSPSPADQPAATHPVLSPDVTGASPAPVERSSPTVPDQSPETVRIDMSSVIVNRGLDAMPDAARIFYDPELYDEVLWDQEAVIRYYGRDLSPSWVPDSLTSFNPASTLRAHVRKEDGAVVDDTLYLRFYQTYGTWEDGTPRTIDERTVSHGFTLSVSKLGFFNCGIVYLRPEDEVKASDIAETPVTIGYRAMSYGPYDPETHEPTGYYDLYVAEFSLEDIGFQLVAYEMELEEVIRVVASIIRPEAEIVLG